MNYSIANQTDKIQILLLNQMRISLLNELKK